MKLMIRVAFIAILLFLPVFSSAQGLVPQCSGNDCQVFHLVQLVQNLINWLITIAVFVAVGLLAYAGFELVTSGGNESARSKAHSLVEAIIAGFIIMLSAWLVVDVFLRVLTGYGLASEKWKIDYVTQPDFTDGPLSNIREPWAPGAGYSGAPGAQTGGGRGVAQCADSNPNCSVAYLQSLGLTPAQAQAMSCIAITENSGGAVGCSGTGPCGTFQITKTNWRDLAPASCRAEDFGGDIEQAQNNGECNARVMVSLVHRDGYQPWTGHHNGVYWNPAARECVKNYDPTNL